MNSNGQDVHGQAILDYHLGMQRGPLIVYNSYGAPEKMPIEVFFRGEDDFTDLESYAISLAAGKVLDVGAGAGAVSLYIQETGGDCTGLDYSPGCVKVMEDKGLKKVVHGDIFTYGSEKFDTIMLLMNGIGLAGTVKNLEVLLETLEKLLFPGGQLLFDSSDVSYLKPQGNRIYNYIGEVRYQYAYAGVKGEWFDWLYIEQEILMDTCHKMGLPVQVVFEDDTGQYLARVLGRN